MARTIIDGLWYFGGNRERGIGKYLDYYFREVCPIPEEDRWWLVPQSAPDHEVNRLFTAYGGQSIELDLSMDGQRQQDLLDRWLDEKEVVQALVSSPFERPRSMLDFITLLKNKSIHVEAIVFDLLPLQYREEILATWPSEDQEMYERRLRRLRRVDVVWAISPQTRQALLQLLELLPESVTVLSFGLTPDWIQAPEGWQRKNSVESKERKIERVLTISGGEWRKNLVGTLKYFAERWQGKPAQLRIVCRLGWKERVRFFLLAIRFKIWKQVLFLGEVSEERKWQELGSADVFLFLSKAEGLGIPLLEARKAKIPEIVISQELAKEGFGSLVPGHRVA